MFGSEEILAFIRRSMGVRGDAADTAGSLHSKVKKLSDDALAALAKAPWDGKPVAVNSGYIYSSVAGDGIYHDILRLTGPRIILDGYVNFEQNSDYIYRRIVIDDTTIATFSGDDIQTYNLYSWNPSSDSRKNTHSYRLPYGYGKYYNAGEADYSIGARGVMIKLPALLPIRSSLVVEYMITSGNTKTINTQYGIWHVAA
jgi:hypothetical protein